MTSEEKRKKTYNLLLQHCTPDLEGKLKHMENYKTTETDQDRINMVKLIRSVCHLQYNYN